MKDCKLAPWGQKKNGYKNAAGTLKCLVILAGKSNVGKSSTLARLGDFLRSESSSFYEHKSKTSSHDRQMAVNYKRNTVGIGTAGDTTDLADDNIKFFLWQKCRIGILAANMDGNAKVVVHISDWAKKRGVKCVILHKPDFQTDLGRIAIQVACAEAIKRALDVSSSIKNAINMIKAEDAAIAKMQ